jgi:hypothetical protein
MDKLTEIRRTINYISDLIDESERMTKSDAGIDYHEYYRNYGEVIGYLKAADGRIGDGIPELVKPNIFNGRIGGLWTITLFGLVNPFLAILIFTITFPVSIPYLIIRGFTIRKTMDRIEDAKIFLNHVLNRLNEQKMEMTNG